MDAQQFEQWQLKAARAERHIRMLMVLLNAEMMDIDENTTDDVISTLNAQISEATGVKSGNFIQSVADALTLVPEEWSWEPQWQKMLQQLHKLNPGHAERIGALGASRQTPDGQYTEILFPLPIAISMTALQVHRDMSLRREQGRL